ncbi:aromatic compound degradation protein PaaI [Serinicoccus sp. CUA-874]|uniref:hotdog fold thioesterase n=1 Tax=Serinicoccus sp. CUA-874 TaxID=1517939 RepID=UPI000969A77C|nr:hotdog fold thioesterase [Serinicoccus sp. CUA-874]OLT18514.1 aromatic compound degradation protein PaaI [Serinicoccus sp. CUA-874]
MTDTPTPRPPADAAATPGSPAPADVPRGDLAERMGMRLVQVGAERTVATMPVAGNTQPYGLLHGGASAALAETVGSVAAAMHAGEGRIAVGVDLNATHHRAVREGVVTAVATPLSLGRSVVSYDIVVTDEQDRRVCTARLTCALRERPPGG